MNKLFFVSLVVIVLSACSPVSTPAPAPEVNVLEALSSGTSNGVSLEGNPELQAEVEAALLAQTEAKVSANDRVNETELSKVPANCIAISYPVGDGEVVGYWYFGGSGYYALSAPNEIGKNSRRFYALPGIYRVKEHSELGHLETDQYGIDWIRILNKSGKAGWIPTQGGNWCEAND